LLRKEFLLNIAFDFDGTLVDAENRQMALLHSILQQFDLEADLDAIWELKRSGLSTKEAIERCLGNRFSVEIIVNIWIRDVEQLYWLKYDKLFKDVYQNLKNLKREKHELFLITARSIPRNFQIQFSWLGLREVGLTTFCVNPKNKTIQKAQVLRDINAEIFIGDSEYDMESSSRAEIDFWAVCSGQRSEEYLRKNGADLVFQSTNQAIAQILDGI
jgi:phosphoglycolate phosphatase-like HAD superfamily hydrolase